MCQRFLLIGLQSCSYVTEGWYRICGSHPYFAERKVALILLEVCSFGVDSHLAECKVARPSHKIGTVHLDTILRLKRIESQRL